MAHIDAPTSTRTRRAHQHAPHSSSPELIAAEEPCRDWLLPLDVKRSSSVAAAAFCVSGMKPRNLPACGSQRSSSSARKDSGSSTGMQSSEAADFGSCSAV